MSLESNLITSRAYRSQRKIGERNLLFSAFVGVYRVTNLTHSLLDESLRVGLMRRRIDSGGGDKVSNIVELTG